MFSFWFFNDQMFFNKVNKLIKTVEYIIPYIFDALDVHPSRWIFNMKILRAVVMTVSEGFNCNFSSVKTV